MTAQARHSGYLVPLPTLPPAPLSFLAMAHLSICDTRHGFVAGWLDGWLEAVSGGQVDNGAIHVRYGWPDTLYDATI